MACTSDLSPQSTIKGTETSTACPFFFSFTFVLKLSPDNLYTARHNHANLSKNSSSPLGFDALGDYLVDSLRQETSLVKDNLQDMVMHHIVAVGRDFIGVHRDGTPSTVSFISIYLNSAIS
jgi:hypothetical protein